MPAPIKDQIVMCRDCKHWLTRHREHLENLSRDVSPKEAWVYGVCPVLPQELDIEAEARGGWEGATVDSVETTANFWCAFGET
jgi:hypothetical protein